MKAANSAVHDKINSETLLLLKTYGIKGWSMDTVRQKSGIAKDTLYRMVGSKEKLIQRVLLKTLSEHSERMSEALRYSETITEALHTSAVLLVRLMDEIPPEHLQVVFLEFLSLETGINDAMNGYFNVLSGFFEAQKAASRIRRDGDISLLIGIIHAAVMAFIKHPEKYDLNSSVKTFIIYLAEGILTERGR